MSEQQRNETAQVIRCEKCGGDLSGAEFCPDGNCQRYQSSSALTLCLRPRIPSTGQTITYPWYLRPKDVIRCRCDQPTCADVSANPEPYWLPQPDVFIDGKPVESDLIFPELEDLR